MLRAILAILLALSLFDARAADLPFVDWEDQPVHALDLSPNGKLLAVAHTADSRVQLFDVSSGDAVAIGHVMVGTDPVSVRFRNDDELWVVNLISDSVSVVDVARRQVKTTLATADEPFDVVFANGRAFVSCSEANRVLVFDTGNLASAPTSIAIAAENPRALAVSADGRNVYAAIFASGNGTTLIAGGLTNNNANLPNAVSDPRSPYAGQNPPPNSGSGFDPPINPLATPPRVGLIVRKRADGHWRDDNNHDWTEFVSGSLATASGRRVGWDLPDRDLAIIDSASLAVRYVSGLLNIGMAVAVNPVSGDVSVVGTDAINEVRFEPRVNGRFVRVNLARVTAANENKLIVDLNPQLNYQQSTLPQAQRDLALGDPRAMVWRGDGQRAWIAGLGSNNVVAIDAGGQRVGAPIAVGQGPAGLAFDSSHHRLYVWNHFDASLSVVDTDAGAELHRVEVFNPLPAAIRAGRPFLYDTHRTSGLGQAACASCHVDSRMDRLAWDLGDPSGAPAAFNQNCGTTFFGIPPCQDFQAMKGPMTTQTLQDIVGHEPFHWRGDRNGIEAFNPAFQSLLGDDHQLTVTEMQMFENFLDRISFPPNPFRNFDNSLPTQLALDGQYTSGRFAMAGLPLGTGDAVRGLQLYSRGLLDTPFHCASCHTLPTGMAVNGPLFIGAGAFAAGGSLMETGPLGENHLGIVSVDGSTNVSIKVPQLRNQYQKVGFNLDRNDSQAGFGFLHDGSVDSLSRFISARNFAVRSDQDVADLVALMMAFSGSDFGIANPVLGGAAPSSHDSPAAVGAQLTLSSPAAPERIAQMLELAHGRSVDLVVRAGTAGYTYDAASDRFLPPDNSPPLTPAALQSLASADRPQTWTVVPAGLGRRLGIDRDGDGVADAVEIRQGSNPADAASKTLRATPGLWFNPQRSGHGFDLQYRGSNMIVIWYTYNDDGSPTWYMAAAPIANPFVGELDRFTWNPATGFVDYQNVGELRLSFASASSGTFNWRLGTRSGTESVQPLNLGAPLAVPERTGAWYTEAQPGWGISIYTEGAVRTSVLYFYDGNNQPRWVLGQGENIGSETLPMWSFRGFCPDCAVSTPTHVDAGQITIRFDAERRATLSTDVFEASQPGAHWLRGPVPIVPLSDAAQHPERF